ncbi:GFA family protein [Devosia rhodophyticola]|uniref:GFA family protein n=1 Tax=Devosia rhodophyticola TaxID=3026423 RepID=A0ABY7YUU4_9HYPH|nr:GFA family protein [Devosia rhodophyticola]WDR05026.1 GFA family protein [Devosia rhodophyticola]
MSDELTGGCLCGAVRYRVADEFEYAANCHCSNCRRATGSAFKPFAGITVEKFHITAGGDSLLIYGDPSAHDAHCAKCGSLLYSLVRDGTYFHIPMGTLADAPSMFPTAHIFVASKAPWYEITDGLPQYDSFADD